MAPDKSGGRRLIVNADDFGRSRSINEAIVRAHREGILTTASLMVNGEAFEEAVELARQNPKLGVGLHLTLICGTSTLSHHQIPGLVDRDRNFSNDPVGAGIRYFFRKKLHQQLADELDAQVQRFKSTGLVLDHLNGHLHFHLHPVPFGIIMQRASAWGVTRVRLTRDRFFLNAKLAQGRWGYRISHGIIFSVLSNVSRKEMDRRGVKHTDHVFGLLQSALVDEAYMSGLIPCLPPGDSELYSHPSLDEFRNEFEALISPRVKRLVEAEKISLIRYQDL